MIALVPALPYTIVNALQSVGDVTSNPVAVPNPNGNVLSWQYSFAVAPDAVSLELLASLDGVNYKILDTGVEVTGEMRILTPTGMRFIKVRQASRTGALAYLTVVVMVQHA